MLTFNEYLQIGVLSLITAIIGALYVTFISRSASTVIAVVLEAPLFACLVLATIAFVMGVASVIANGHTFTESLFGGMGAVVLYGLGGAIYGAPGAIVGGFLCAVIQRRCHRPG